MIKKNNAFYKYILFILSVFPVLAFPQGQIDIDLGNTYQEVMSKLQNDKMAQNKNITQLQNKIIVSIKPDKGLSETVIYEYYFEDNRLTKDVIVTLAADLDGLISWTYQNVLPNYGEPIKLLYEGNKAYNWPKLDQKKGCKHYLYIAFSDWFQKDAVFNVDEIIKESSFNSKSPDQDHEENIKNGVRKFKKIQEEEGMLEVQTVIQDQYKKVDRLPSKSDRKFKELEYCMAMDYAAYKIDEAFNKYMKSKPLNEFTTNKALLKRFDRIHEFFSDKESEIENKYLLVLKKIVVETIDSEFAPTK